VMKRNKWIAVLAVLALVAIALAAGPALAANWNQDAPQAPIGNDGRNPDDGGTAKPVDPSVPPAYDTVKDVAPIESVDIRIGESMPPQYFAHVEFGLPSGCVEPGGYEVTRDGNTVRIDVSILKPAPDADVMCTMIYGIGSYDVALGSDFESGQTYVVDVNGTVVEFVAQ
jgi:hypothetical protein